MAALEDSLCGRFGFAHAVLFGRARGALAAIVETEEKPPVLLPSNVCPAVLAAVIAGGGTPHLVPVDPASGLAGDDRFAAALADCPADRGIVMPTHLYGFWSPYPRTARSARERGWRVVENDCMATLAVESGLEPLGDSLLVSFGSGKTIDAGGGGVLLTNDASLRDRLSRKAAGWPYLDERAEAVEAHLVTARRALRQLAVPEVAEHFFSIDRAEIRHALPEARRPAIERALSRFEAAVAQRRERLAAWDAALAGFGEALSTPPVRNVAPWRAIRRARSPQMRDRIVAALRKAGFDAGTNYPPLTETYPLSLAGQAQAEADLWGATVLNLWLSPDYDDARIAQAAAVIAAALDGEER